VRRSQPSRIRHTARLFIMLALAGVLAAANACSSSKPHQKSSASSSTGGGNTVTVKNFGFNPAKLTVATGTTVTWTFEDQALHNATADDETFMSPSLNNGKTFKYTFTKPGTYTYICTIHQYMHGTITVTP
jgi:plastocyanin